MRTHWKKTIVGLVLLAQLNPVVIALAGGLVAFAPSPALAHECTGDEIHEISTTDGGEQTHSCRKVGTSITQGITNNPEAGGWFYNTIWLPMMSWVASLFLDIGGGLLRLAGYFFDILIKYIVIEFGQTMEKIGAMKAINIGWTVFRDFSNILIIGFFVFVAISIILGLSEFGQKRLIANVLVVAVLMNFSLLFTKLIIDGSNFFAYQVYSTIAASTCSQATQGTTQQAGTFNISECFLRAMKPGGIWNTYGLVSNVAKSTGSVGQAFLFGLVGGALLIAVAAVLFYGSFLVVWRGVLFIMLMLTAPFAFATYLVPTLAKGEYGWNSWWKMLINNAAFGPLLMILLALSLAIINAAGQKTTGTIGDLISNPGAAQPSAWVTMLVYFLGIGLLFVSLKLASSFAGSIGGGYGGVNWLSGGLAKLAGLGPIAGAAALAGAGLRNRFGGRAAFRSLDLESRIEDQRARVRAQPDDKLRFQENQKLMALIKQKGKADAGAKREYNFENTQLGKYLKEKGMPSLAGDTKGGFEGPRKKVAEEAAKSMQSAVISKDQAETIAKTIVGGQQADSKRALEAQKESNQQIIKAAESMADSVKRNMGLQEEHNRALEKRVTSTQIQAQAESDHKAGKISTAKREEIMREEDQRIKEAKEAIERTKQKMQDIDVAHKELPHVQEARTQMAAAEAGLRDLQREHGDAVRDLQKKLVEQSIDDAASLATSIHHLDAYETKVTGKQIRAKLKNKRLVDQARAVQEEIGSESNPAEGGEQKS